MRLFDPHVHMTSRTTDDYEAMAHAGILAIVEASRHGACRGPDNMRMKSVWLSSPRTPPPSVKREVKLEGTVRSGSDT